MTKNNKTPQEGRFPKRKRLLISCGTIRPEGAAINKKYMEVAGYVYPDGFRPAAACSPEKGYKFSSTGETVRFRREVKLDILEGASIAVMRVEAPIEGSSADEVVIRVTNLQSNEMGEAYLQNGEVMPMYIGSISPARQAACSSVIFQLNRFCKQPGLFAETDEDGNAIRPKLDQELTEWMVKKNVKRHPIKVVVGGGRQETACHTVKAGSGIVRAEVLSDGVPVDEPAEEVGVSMATAFDNAMTASAAPKNGHVRKVPVVQPKKLEKREKHNKASGIPDPGGIRILCIEGKDGELTYASMQEVMAAVRAARSVRVENVAGGQLDMTEEEVDAISYLAGV